MDRPAFVPLFLRRGRMGGGVSHCLGRQPESLAAALRAAAAGLGTLALLTAATGGALIIGLNLQAIQFVIGVFLLLFGVRWMAKAIARQAGLKALHDEDAEFRETRARIGKGDWFAAWLVAYKGTLMEGLEVWLIVVAFSLRSQAWIGNGIAAWPRCWRSSPPGWRSGRRCAGCRRTRSSSSSAR